MSGGRAHTRLSHLQPDGDHLDGTAAPAGPCPRTSDLIPSTVGNRRRCSAMSWRSVGSSRYYQRSYRDPDGRVRSHYVGCGPVAEAVAARDALRRERRIDAILELEI